MQEMNILHTDTICAVSTAPGVGGIAVIRLSGTQAIVIAEQLTKTALTRPVQFCHIEGMDDVVVTVFHSPHSYTGEDVVEVSCHGSLYIQQTLLRQLISLGARLARAGEFTERAFLNGKMDLSEAEAVADLIAAENEASHRLALAQMKGAVSHELQQLRERLLRLTSLLELELDFADHEDVEFADRSELVRLASLIEEHLRTLCHSFKAGNAIKNGIGVAIIGHTNAGKSTLLNTLVGEERAIVSDIHGTTRDVIEDSVVLNGIRFRFIDTAGIRQTDNKIEQIGIERSRLAAQKADIICLVMDATDYHDIDDDTIETQREELLNGIDCSNKEVIIVLNKADLLSDNQRRLHSTHIYKNNIVLLSAQKGETEELKEWLLSIGKEKTASQSVVISNLRHLDALQRALYAIEQVQIGLQEQLSGELLSLDLHDCINALGEITGQITSDEVLHSIFKNFCIGK